MWGEGCVPLFEIMGEHLTGMGILGRLFPVCVPLFYIFQIKRLKLEEKLEFGVDEFDPPKTIPLSKLHVIAPASNLHSCL